MLAPATAVVALLLARGAAGQLNLLVVGDWGGASTAPYTTAVQLSVAAAMGAVGAANKITEVFGVGDNFYGKGNAVTACCSLPPRRALTDHFRAPRTQRTASRAAATTRPTAAPTP